MERRLEGRVAVSRGQRAAGLIIVKRAGLIGLDPCRDGTMVRIDDIDLVRRLPLFADMEAESFEALMQVAYLQQFPPQLELLAEGDKADFLYVLIEGKIELLASAAGRETTMFVQDPVSTFILAAVLRDEVYLMSARTIEKSRLLLIPARDTRDVFARDTAFARSIVLELAGAFRGVVKSLKNQKLRSSAERLANYLLVQERQQGGRGSLALPVDKKTLAALLGMTPENLSRAFNTLAPYGVTVDGPRIGIADTDDLARLARPHRLIDDPAS